MRVLCMTSASALLGLIFGVVPGWPSRFYFEGPLWGMALGICVVIINRGEKLAKDVIMAGLFGMSLSVIAAAGYPMLGMTLLAAGIASLCAKNRGDAYTVINTVLATILAALLAVLAGSRISSLLFPALPWSLASAIQWSILGMFISLGAIPIHVGIRGDSILAHTRSVNRRLDRKHRESLVQVLDQYLELIINESQLSRENFDTYLMDRARGEDELLYVADACLTRMKLDGLSSAISIRGDHSEAKQ